VDDSTGEATGFDAVQTAMYDTLVELRDNKPNDRSELDRRYAVTITEMEKVYAYFLTFGRKVEE
jgi:hypothetical protein